MKNIVCIESCDIDYNMIECLIKKCNVKRIAVPRQLAGRYVLAFDGSKLIGMSAITGKAESYVIDGYDKNAVMHALSQAVINVQDRTMRSSGIRLTVA